MQLSDNSFFPTRFDKLRKQEISLTTSEIRMLLHLLWGNHHYGRAESTGIPLPVLV